MFFFNFEINKKNNTQQFPMCYDLCKTSIFTNFKFHHVYTYLRSTFTNAKFNKSLENQIYRSLLTVILRFYDSYSEYHKKKLHTKLTWKKLSLVHIFKYNHGIKNLNKYQYEICYLYHSFNVDIICLNIIKSYKYIEFINLRIL